jgi:hypothetical protein
MFPRGNDPLPSRSAGGRSADDPLGAPAASRVRVRRSLEQPWSADGSPAAEVGQRARAAVCAAHGRRPDGGERRSRHFRSVRGRQREHAALALIHAPPSRSLRARRTPGPPPRFEEPDEEPGSQRNGARDVPLKDQSRSRPEGHPTGRGSQPQRKPSSPAPEER